MTENTSEELKSSGGLSGSQTLLPKDYASHVKLLTLTAHNGTLNPT